MSGKLKVLIACAIFVRIFLASFLYHPDLRLSFFHGQFLSRGIFNIYSFLEENRTNLPNFDRFNYPPLAYYFFGSWHSVASAIFGPQLNSWLNDWSGRDVNHPNLFAFLLFLKLPYFAIDFLALRVLLSLVPVSKKTTFSLVWLFNPITLYGTYAVGQFDILPTWLTLVALARAEKNRLADSSVLLVLAGLLKSYPLLLLPFIWLKAGSLVNAFRLLLLSCATWIVIQLPFIASAGYIQSVFMSGLTQRIISTTINFGSNISVSPFLAGLVVLLCYSLAAKTSLRFQFLTVTLLVILFTSFHAQWLIWWFPFALLLWHDQKHLWLPAGLITISAYALIFLLPDKFTLVGLLAGMNPHFLTIPHLPSLLDPIELSKLSTVSRTVLVASGLWSLYATSKS